MAACGGAGDEAAAASRPALRSLRAGTGAPDDRARAGARAGTTVLAVPQRRDATAADGASRTRAGEAGPCAQRLDRAPGEWALGRGLVPAVVPVAPARPEGRPRGARSGLRVRTGDNPEDTHIVWRGIGMVNLDLSADVDQRKHSRESIPRSETLCRRCGKREALGSRDARNRRANRKRHHDLCSRCRRALRDSTRNPVL